MDNQRFRLLLHQYFDNSINRADCEELLAYLDRADPLVVNEMVDQALSDRTGEVAFGEADRQRVYTQLIADRRFQENKSDKAAFRIAPLKKILRVAAVCIIACFVGYAANYAFQAYIDRQSAIAVMKSDDILLPDENKATLTLADGRTILLNDTEEGTLAREGGVNIKKTEDGSIRYEAPASTSMPGGEIKFNTMTTPKGHFYQLLLPDGTRVWLNTSSSIRFPVVFAQNERKVILKGEAYFEVAPHNGKPFVVEANGTLVRVLGTHFNVSAYEDEAKVTTTLIEGAVKVAKGKEEVSLKPGQQAIVDENHTIRQSPANIKAVLAWKNGYFRFENEGIKSIMGKISRWYDIDEVRYEGSFDDLRFGGTFHRSKEVSKLFSHLEKLAPLKFRIEGRRVIIMK